MPADRTDLQAEIPPPDDSDILLRLEHAAAGNEVIARLGEVMARITADDPATAAFWASLAGHQPQQDASNRSAPRLGRRGGAPRGVSCCGRES